ncbi:hypothetical protein [Sphingomonas jatrophae]|uniref:hypothetical protein n=1 Tax=Sphingomonas jatrophae TaxID=1166337 RepID=UPI001041D55F|nr:hypothetical protein [Sphingomonas jatrophae]
MRKIFYLEPTRTYLFEIIPINTSPPPGTDDPRVTALLRRMLYLRVLHPPMLRQLAEDARALLAERQMIAIAAKLLSLMRDVFNSPWAFPALMQNKDIIAYRSAFSGVVDVTGVTANVTGSTPAAYALSFLSRFAGTAVGHGVYMASLTNRHYDYYLQKMNAELQLRGVNTALLP